MSAEKNSLLKNKQHVISMGSSLTRHAIYYDDEMEVFAKMQGYENYAFTRFVLGGSHLSQFFPLFDHIIAAKPDIILFQHSFLAYKKKFIENHHGKVHDYRYFYKQLFENVINRGGSFKKYRHNREQKPAMPTERIEIYRRKAQTPARLEKIKKRRKKWRIWKNIKDIPVELDEFLKQAARANIKVIILNLPRPEESRMLLPGTQEEYFRLMKAYETKYQVTYLHYPHQLELDSFIDYNHMTPATRDTYISWLLKELETVTD